jgi:hypothetical protein
MAKKTNRLKGPRDSNTVAILIVAAASAGMIFVWGLLFRPSADSLNDGNLSNDRMSLEGHVVCLPHKEGGGQSAECAYGIHLEDGTYYAIKGADDDNEIISSLPFDRIVRLTGTYKSDSDEIYQSSGTFTVTNAETL